MMLDEALRAVVRSEMQNVLREELRAQLLAAVQARRPQRAEAEEGLLSIAQAASYAGVHERTMRAWVTQGKLRRYKAGRVLRVERAELQAYLARGPGADEVPVSVDARVDAILRKSGRR